MDQLATYAVNSRPARTILKAGGNTSSATRVLNPLFVEALMGWPIGWTDMEARLHTAPPGCGLPETAWCRWLRRMRGELSRLDLIRIMHESEG